MSLTAKPTPKLKVVIRILDPDPHLDQPSILKDWSLARDTHLVKSVMQIRAIQTGSGAQPLNRRCRIYSGFIFLLAH